MAQNNHNHPNAIVHRSRQAGKNSGSGTITIINEAVKRDNKFILLK